MRPKRSSAARDHRLDLVPLGDVAVDRQRPLLAAELGGQLLASAPARRAARTRRCVAGGGPRGRGADPAAGAGDQEDGVSAAIGRRFFAEARAADARGGLAIIRACPMDPQRKRKIRLVVALGAAVLLAAALVYTSFSASTEAKQPSQLLDAAPGQELRPHRPGRHGHRAPATGRALRFRVADRDDASASDPGHLPGHRPRPVPRRPRDHPHRRRSSDGDLRRRARHPGDQVPVEVHGGRRIHSLGSAALALAFLTALYAAGRGAWPDATATAAGSTPRGAPSTRSARC